MKKIFLLIMLSASSLFAGQDYFFKMRNPEELDAFATVFNAIPMFLGSGDYLDLLRLTFLFGGFLVFSKVVLNAGKDGQGGLVEFTKYNILSLAILVLVFSDKSTVILKTETPVTYYQTTPTTTMIAIDNIPTTLAFSYNFFQRMGDGLSSMYDMAFATVSDVNPAGGSYSMNRGYASSISNDLKFLTYDFNRNFELSKQIDEFFAECIYIPYSASSDGMEKIGEITRSDNIMALVGSWINGGVEIGGVKAGDYTAEYAGGIYSCSTFYNLIATETIPAFLATAPNDPVLKEMNIDDLRMITADKSVPVSDFEQMAIQAGIINTLANPSSLPTGVTYAQGNERAKFNMNNISQSFYMAQQFPYMQSVIRALFYAAFPFLFVVMLLPGGIKVVAQYGKSLIWVESWDILASVLNYMIHTYTEMAVAKTGHTGLSLVNSADLLSPAASMAGMAGYYYMSIPAISWLLLTGSGQMLGSLAGSMAASFSRNLGTAENAKDIQAMKTKDAVSKEVGHDVSYAEAMAYKANQDGTKAGMEIGINQNQGNNFNDKLAYDFNSGYNSLAAKQQALGGNWKDVMKLDNEKLQRETSQNSALVNNTTNKNASDTGTLSALDQQNNSYKVDNYSPENINELNKFKTDETMIGGLQKMSVYDNSSGGRLGTIAGMEDIKAGTEVGTYNKNMNYADNSTAKLAEITSQANLFNMARTDGNVSTTTTSANYKTGVKEGAGTNANAQIVDEFGDKNITKNEVYKQETDIWANQAKEEQQASLGGVKTNVQDAAKVEVNDKKADVLTTDNDGNGKLSKSELKDRLDTNTTENQAGHGAKKANLKTEQQLAEQLIASDPLAKQGAKNVPTGNSGTKNAQFRAANNHIKKHNDIRSNSVEAKDQRFKDQAGVTASDEALTKASDTTEKVYTTTNSADNRAALIKDDVKENYNDVYKQNLKEAEQKGLHGAKAREFAALQTEKDMGNINIGKNNKNLYDARLQGENERISSQRKALGDRNQTKETLSKQKEALQHYKDSGGHDKTVLENFNRNIKANEAKLQQHNQLDKDAKNAKFNVQQQMVKEGRASISGGKFRYNDFSNEMNGKDNNAKVLETAKVGGTKGSGKTQILDSTGKQVTSTKDHTSDVDNVAATAQVGKGTQHVGGTDPYAHLNKAGHQDAADNLATGEKYLDKGLKVVETVAPVKNGIKAVVKAATKK